MMASRLVKVPSPTHVDLTLMRRIAALQTCIALLAAFLLAPFQHVHTGQDHDHSGLIHAHFYHFHVADHSVDEPHGVQIADFDDDDHADARSLDTYTIEIAAALAPFVLSRGPALAFVPSETFQPVEIVEERGHDPPCIDRSIPRAPPA
jgi:hypothetical protein